MGRRRVAIALVAGGLIATACTGDGKKASEGTIDDDASPSDAPAAAPDLARTGLKERTLRLAGFAVGIAFIGIGLLLANRRTALR